LTASLSRRELILRGAIGGAALALPLPEALAAVRRRRRRDSVHCLPALDRFAPTDIFTDCSFAAFDPSGQRVALATARGVEILNRADGARVAATPPGFSLTADAWHPDGSAVLVSGPAPDGSGPYLHAITGAGLARLLPDHPGQARAACFSPDGNRVAFTYLNRFAHQLCLADWTAGALTSPRNLLPADPATEGNLTRLISSLASYETRGFSPDGRRLYFASDRGAGMLNVSVHFLDLATAKRSRVTYDEGVAEGAVVSPDNAVLYSATTRAREPAFLTMVSGPAVPPLLGFVAEPTLHEQLAAKKLAMIGNGDAIAMDPTYGLRARMVGNRRTLAKKLNAPVAGGTYRVGVCSMSPDGTELAVAMTSAVGSNVVVLRRAADAVGPPVAVRATPSPPGSAELSAAPLAPVDRTVDSEFGGRLTLRLDGELGAGDFSFAFENFSDDGVHFFGGTARFQTRAGGFRHTADVRRVNLESQEEVGVFYNADMQVVWREEIAPGVDGQPVTSGSIASLSRSGDCSAAWDGSTFAPQDGWNAGNRGPRPVPGAMRCRRGLRA
jgi:hypothetical protein